jgi:hypothetical protein
MACSTAVVSIPVRIIEPASIASGLSMESLKRTAPKPVTDDSSLIVPESEITNLASV